MASNEQTEGRPEAGYWEARHRVRAETGPARRALSVTPLGGEGTGIRPGPSEAWRKAPGEASGTSVHQGAAPQAVKPVTLDGGAGSWAPLASGSWLGGAFPGSGSGGGARG